MGVRIIYVPKEEEEMWKRFKKATKRDGTNMSAVILKKVKEWMVTHEPGNPQTAITSFSKQGKVTVAGIEGRVRQLCLEYHDFIPRLDILRIIRNQGISDGNLRIAMSERIIEWLENQGRKIIR